MHRKSVPHYQANSGDTFRHLEHARWTNIREERDYLHKESFGTKSVPFKKVQSP